MINAIRNYFLQYTKFPTSSTIGVDALDNEIDNFSIDFLPSKRVLKTYLNGTTERQQLFVLAGRFAYNNDNSVVLNFFNDLEQWIESNNNADILPELTGKQIAEKVEVLSNGYLINQNGSEARYQIQLRLLYREEE